MACPRPCSIHTTGYGDPRHVPRQRSRGQQVRFFRAIGRPFEWKHDAYDRPADLPRRLLGAGFVAEPEEAKLAAERGFRWIQVDASADSSPILERLGFIRVTTTTPYRRHDRRRWGHDVLRGRRGGRLWHSGGP
jgi:hypothetical protein